MSPPNLHRASRSPSLARGVALALCACLLPSVAAPAASSAEASHAAPPPLPALGDGRSWWRADFHAHARSGPLGDDGSDEPAALHALLAQRGFHFTAHTPHSVYDGRPDGTVKLARARADEEAASTSVAAVGQELEVAHGSAYRSSVGIFGFEGPGHNDHLTLLGGARFVLTGSTIPAACDEVHRWGGVCIVNHPGPGPLMWEPGLWEAPGNGRFLDGIEVYNGTGMTLLGVDFEARYLEATAVGGLALKLAAVTGTDTHGRDSIARARGHLRRLIAAVRVLHWLAPPTNPDDDRPELAAATWVLAPSPSLTDVLAAVRARRTVATWRFDLADAFACPGLGEVRRDGRVELSLRLGRPVERIVLYRDGEPLRTWSGRATVEHHERITRPATYVFAATDGAGRLMTSAIWYEPEAGADYD